MVERSFVFNEEWEEQRKDLQNILGQIENPKLIKNKFVLETFARACAYSLVRGKPRRIPLEKLKRELGVKKDLRKLLKIPIGSSVQPVPIPGEQPLHKYKEVPHYMEKEIKVPPKKPQRPKPKKRRLLELKRSKIVHKELIRDKMTGRVLAKADVADRYVLDEPKLDSKDFQVLDEIRKKRKVKDMEKGWELIQKYGKKFKIERGHDTLIKYYVVNDRFGMGRIEPLLHDMGVRNIVCDDFTKPVTVEFQGKKLETNLKFGSKEELKEFVFNMASLMDKKIDKKNTKVDGSLRGFSWFLDVGESLDKPKFSAARK